MLRAEIEKRAPTAQGAGPGELCPDKKVTRRDRQRSRSLQPVADRRVIDEVQNLFAHPKYGKQAGEDAVFIIKIGPAFGVFLILATQRPDKESLPTGVTGNVSTRFCLKVMGQIENDMILGTSAYKNGIRATTFRPEIDAGLGYLSRRESAPQVVRTYYLNMPATERVAKRARQLREAAGTLSGVALGQADDDARARRPRPTWPRCSAPTPGCTGPSSPTGSPQRFPERWAGASGDAVSAEARRARRAERGRPWSAGARAAAAGSPTSRARPSGS